jgi:hypothetical protein
VFQYTPPWVIDTSAISLIVGFTIVLNRPSLTSYSIIFVLHVPTPGALPGQIGLGYKVINAGLTRRAKGYRQNANIAADSALPLDVEVAAADAAHELCLIFAAHSMLQ